MKDSPNSNSTITKVIIPSRKVPLEHSSLMSSKPAIEEQSDSVVEKYNNQSQIDSFKELAEKTVSNSEIPRARMDSPKAPWVFQEFPSHFVPYGGQRFFIRPLDWELLSKLHAIRTKRNSLSFSMMLDVLNNCFNGIDIRDLTMGDFYSFLYWLRINSYPKTPLSMEFSSKYGGPPKKIYIRMSKIERDTKVARIEKLGQTTKDKNWHELEIVELEMTLEQYQVWKEKGIRFPTVRDFELLSSEPIADEDVYISRFAQYIYIPKEELTADNYFQKHMQKLKELDLSLISDIDEFAESINHGVIEKVGVVNNDIDLNVYLSKITQQRDIFHNIVMTALDDESSDKGQVAIVTANLAELNAEIERVQNAIDNNEKLIPDEEEVRITINLDTMFPIV